MVIGIDKRLLRAISDGLVRAINVDGRAAQLAPAGLRLAMECSAARLA
jgi:hypothetical protein